MNALDSLEAYLAYQQYLNRYERTTSEGTREPDSQVGPNPDGPDVYVPGQGSTRVPLYTSGERFRVAPEGFVVEQRGTGRILVFNLDPQSGAVTLSDEETGQSATVTRGEGNRIEVVIDGQVSTFEDPEGPTLRQLLGGTTRCRCRARWGVSSWCARRSGSSSRWDRGSPAVCTWICGTRP